MKIRVWAAISNEETGKTFGQYLPYLFRTKKKALYFKGKTNFRIVRAYIVFPSLKP